MDATEGNLLIWASLEDTSTALQYLGSVILSVTSVPYLELDTIKGGGFRYEQGGQLLRRKVKPTHHPKQKILDGSGAFLLEETT